MNKISILTLALVIALPGCGNKKKSTQPVKNNNVAKYMNTQGSVEEITEDEEDDGDSEDADIEEEEFDFDDEGDEYGVKEDEDLTDLDDLEGLEALEDDEEDEEEVAFRWIDSQTDDEFKPLYFTFNHYGIRADQKSIVDYDIEQIKQVLADSGTTAEPTIIIEGHACQEGTPAYNVALSEKRAKIVADLFVAAGIDKSSIKVVGRGQECPAVVNGKVVNGSREDRAPNRQVEVRVIYT